METDSDLKTLKQWSGGDPGLTEGLNEMVKVSNALVNAVRNPLSGSGDGGSSSGSPLKIFATLAEAGTGFLRIVPITLGDASLGTPLGGDAEL